RSLLPAALECAEAEVVGLAESDDELRGFYAQEYSGLAVYRTSEELFERGRPEAIVTCADNRASADVVAEAAARGVHVMKEKPMDHGPAEPGGRAGWPLREGLLHRGGQRHPGSRLRARSRGLRGTWTQPAEAVRTPLVIYGTDGSIAVTGPSELLLATRASDG